MKREELIIRCIDDIKAGKLSREECCRLYPGLRVEIESMMQLTLSIDRQPEIKPSDEFKSVARAALMRHIRESKEHEQTTGVASDTLIRPSWFTGWVKVAAIAIAAILLFSAAGTGTAFASQSCLPGDTLYPVKLGTEQAQRIITFDAASEVELELRFAETRLDELEQLAALPESSAMKTEPPLLAMSVIGAVRDDSPLLSVSLEERMNRAAEGYRKNIGLALAKSENITGNDALLETVALAVLKHLDKLDEIEDYASPRAYAALSMSREAAMNGQLKSLQNLAGVQPGKAREINEQAIQKRLARAAEAAARGRSAQAEEALRNAETMRQFGRNNSGSNKQDSQNNRPREPENQKGKPEPATENQTDARIPDAGQPALPPGIGTENQANEKGQPSEQAPGKPDFVTIADNVSFGNSFPGNSNGNADNGQRGQEGK